jgi:Skp family chaperone for outer membrane proteins
MTRHSLRWLPLLIALVPAGAASAPAAGTAAPFRLCVLDQAAIVQQSRLAINQAARFQQIRQQTQANFDNDMRNLDADARALQSLQASLPPAVVKARTEDIGRRRAALKARGDKINTDLAALDTQLTSNLAQVSMPVVRAIEQERGCSMLIARNALLNLDDPTLDITPAVIDRMNAPGADAARSR